MPSSIKKISAITAILPIQFASLQQVILFNPIYGLLFWVIFDAKRIYILFSGLTIFAGIVHSLSANVDSNYFFLLKEYIQLAADILIAGGIIAIIRKSEVDALFRCVNFVANGFLVVAGLSLFDYYFVTIGLNSVLSDITLWPNSGSGFPRLSLTFSNPNWATFTMFLLLVIFCESCKNHANFYWVVSKIIVLIIFFQSKAGIVLSLLYVVFSLVTFNVRYITVVLFTTAISIVSLWGLLVNQTQGEVLMGSASYLNRMEMYNYVLLETGLLPKGLPSSDFYSFINSVSYEDTIPAILKVLYSFGWISFTILMTAAVAVSITNKTKSLLVSVVGFSMSYSLLDVSIVAAQAIVVISFLGSSRLQR